MPGAFGRQARGHRRAAYVTYIRNVMESLGIAMGSSLAGL